MKKLPIVLLITVFAVSLIAPTVVSKAAMQYPAYRNQNQNQNQKKPAAPTVIKSIDAASITVKGPKTTTTYTITNLTEIDYKGTRVAASVLKPGMRVVVTVGLNPSEADRISAEDAPKKK